MKKKPENLENDDFNVKDLSIEELIPNVFDNCIITVFEGHHTLDMPMTMTGMAFTNWMKTKAGIFSKDVFRYTHNKLQGKYVLYEGHDKKFIARLINEDELLIFESLKLIDGYFKDVPYMILKNLKNDESLTNAKRYIEVIPDDVQDHVVMVPDPLRDDDETATYNSVSLFNE